MSLALLAFAALLAQKPEPCDSLSACIAEAHRVADPGEGITSEEQAVAQRLQALGPESIDAVVDLLDDSDEHVRELAGYTIGDMRPLEPRHLEPLRRSLLAGNGWVPAALATVGTPEAMDLLMQALAREREADSQVAFALSEFGSAAVPGLVELFGCRTECDEEHLRAASGVLEDLGEAAQGAARPLAEIASDETRPWSSRVIVVRVLGRLEARAQAALPELLALARSEFRPIREAALDAVLRVGGDASVDLLAEALADSNRRTWTLRDIASHGPSVRKVGPHVEALLADRDPEVRVAAARTLGFIAYAEASPALVAALQDPADWRLVHSAARSLGRLRSKDAREALEATAAQHWYPPVRDVARTALRSIDGAEPVPVPAERFAQEFFDLGQVPGVHGSCDATVSSPLVPRKVKRFTRAESPALAKRLTYDVPARDRKGPFEPDVGLRVPGGWLMGSDHGEFGGELTFRPDRGDIAVVREGNVADLQVVGRDTLVAIGGLAHLTMDSGSVHRVERDERGRWRAVWWRELPGAPEASWPIAGNQLLIVAGGGTVVLSPDGTMALAPCHSTRD